MYSVVLTKIVLCLAKHAGLLQLLLNTWPWVKFAYFRGLCLQNVIITHKTSQCYYFKPSWLQIISMGVSPDWRGLCHPTEMSCAELQFFKSTSFNTLNGFLHLENGFFWSFWSSVLWTKTYGHSDIEKKCPEQHKTTSCVLRTNYIFNTF